MDDALSWVLGSLVLAFAVLFNVERSWRKRAESISRASSRIAKATTAANNRVRDALDAERKRVEEISAARSSAEAKKSEIVSAIAGASSLDDLAKLWNDEDGDADAE